MHPTPERNHQNGRVARGKLQGSSNRGGGKVNGARSNVQETKGDHAETEGVSMVNQRGFDRPL